MEKVLLLNPPGDKLYVRDCFCTSANKAHYYMPPVDFLILSGHLKKSYDVDIIDCIIDGISLARLSDMLKDKVYYAVVFLTSASSWPSDFRAMEEILKKAGKIDHVIVSGGITFFEKEKFFDRYPWLDAIQSNYVTDDILHYLNADHARVKNMFFRTHDGIQYRNAGFSSFSYPVPLYERFKLKKYRLPFFKYSKFASVLTNYGCPFNCSYCVASTIKCVTRDMGNLIDELEFIRKMGVKEILFKDHTFVADKKFTVLLLKEMIARKFNFVWSCNVHPATVDEELIALMKDAGCYFIRMGAETQNSQIFAKYRKSSSPEIISRAVSVIKRNKIMLMTWFLLGFYEETLDEMKKTIDFAVKINPDFASFGVLMPEYGSPLRQEYIKKGWIKDGLSTFDAAGEPTIVSPNFSAQQLGEVVKMAYRKFYYRPEYFLERILDIRHYKQLSNMAFNGLSVFKKSISN